MATIGPTGVGIPDVGDPDAASSQLVIDNIEDYQSHQHRGPAFNEPPTIGGSSWLGDATMDNNGEGITNLIYTSFTDPAAEAIPNRSIYYDDGVGFVFKTEGGAEATLVTSAGSIPTTNGEGFIGLGPPARATYTAGISRFAFYDDFGASNLGDLFASQVKATNNATDCFAQLTSDGTSGALELTEDSADFSFFLKLPAGWNAAASANQEIAVPPEDGIPASAEMAICLAPVEWTPTIDVGLASFSYVTQTGIAQRIGNMVTAHFSLEWTGGNTFVSPLTIGGLPYTAATNKPRISGPVTMPLYILAGAGNDNATGGAPLAYYTLRIQRGTSVIEVRDSTDGAITGYADGVVKGMVTYWVE